MVNVEGILNRSIPIGTLDFEGVNFMLAALKAAITRMVTSRLESTKGLSGHAYDVWYSEITDAIAERVKAEAAFVALYDKETSNGGC